MENISTDNLLLLEFLVESLNLDGSTLKKLKSLKGENYVSFQFLDNAPIDIGEQDIAPQPSTAMDDNATSKMGKSCLFSLTTEQIQEALKNFDVNISVYRKLKPGTLPDKITIGEVVISITHVLIDTLEDFQRTNRVDPVSKMLRRTYTANDYNGIPVAEMEVMIRMSCFGRLIVSQFQMNLQDKTTEFKGKDNQYVIQKNDEVCENREISKQNQSLVCSCQGGNAPCPNAPVYYEPYMPCPPPPPCTCPCPPVCVKCGVHYVYSPPDPICPCVNPEPCEPLEGEYDTIEAEMGGNKFQVRVHKDKKKPGEECKCLPLVDDRSSCDCSQMLSLSGTHSQAGRSNKTTSPDGALWSGQGGCPYTINLDATKPCACTTGLNKTPAGSGDPNSPINVTICGEPQDKKIWVFPPIDKKREQQLPIDLADPYREMYILRIEKKSEKGNMKNNLELELCAPKPIECKPKKPRRHRLTQCYETDFPGGAVRKPEGSKSKGKVAKGGKKKGKK